MSPSKNSAWTKTRSQETLDSLREEYPGYTDNELYAIWCRDNGRLPLDTNGKLNLEQWIMHAGNDGQHVHDDGFRVSRAIYGRALKARKGVAKPPRAKRQKPDNGAAAQNGSLLYQESGGLSERAVALAKSYDRARAIIDQALHKRREAIELMASLQGLEPCIAIDLAGNSDEAHDLLQTAGLMPEPARGAGEPRESFS